MTTTKRQPTVIVFSTPTCSWCRVVKQHLKKHNIRFKDVDISKDERAARDMVRRTGQQGVPVTLINNRPVIGFDKGKIDRLLDIKAH
jgi:glutaredoxin 3